MSAGWLYVRGESTMHYRENGKVLEGDETWPPKYWKFILETEGKQKVEAAFSDARRFGRIRLLDCAAEDIRNTTPLKENGPDPVIDRDILTEEYLEKKMRSKHVPVKALLLDQANVSGIGNYIGLVFDWVSREVCY
jgi:formamidopyrimidine-DNA glycosylase